jgi:hypothetical protein
MTANQGTTMTDSQKLESNIRRMRETLERIRDEAATKENGGSWAAGIAILCLATLRSYNVDIWNDQGDSVIHLREVTAAEVDDIRDQYEDEPWINVVVEESR